MIISNLFGAVREAKMETDFYDYVSCNSITLRLNNNTSLLFDKETESAFFKKDGQKSIPIFHNQLAYNIFGNKGYYLDSFSIISTIYSYNLEEIK